MLEKLGVAYWIKCAADARTLAVQLDDDDAKKHMLRIAEEYETIAERALIRQEPHHRPK